MANKLTSKGQVTIPKAIRDHLGLRPGTAVKFRRLADGEITIEPAADHEPRPSTRLAQLRGIAGPGLSTDEIMALTRSVDKP